MAIAGECLCGAVQVVINQPEEDLKTISCRCTGCKKASGATGCLAWIMPQDKAEVTGPIKEYIDDKTDSGKALARYFCENCGAPVKSISSKTPESVIIKCGLFDRIDKPVLQIYTKNKQEWEELVEGVPHTPAAP